MEWFGLSTLLAEIPNTDSVCPDVLEQQELDLKGPPHFFTCRFALEVWE